MTSLTYKQLKNQVNIYRYNGFLPATTKLNQKREVLEQLVIEGRENRKKQIAKDTAFYKNMILEHRSYQIFSWCYFNGYKVDAESVEYYVTSLKSIIFSRPIHDLPTIDWQSIADAILVESIEENYIGYIEAKYNDDPVYANYPEITEDPSNESVDILVEKCDSCNQETSTENFEGTMADLTTDFQTIASNKIGDFEKMTYWHNNGKHQQKYEELWELVPVNGRASDPHAERLRLVANMYADYYNNGWDFGVGNERRVTDFLENTEIQKIVTDSGNMDAIATYTKISDGWKQFQDDKDDCGCFDSVFEIEGVGEPDFEQGLEALVDLVVVSA